MAHVHFPFQAEEVSFLVTAMVDGRPFPARPNDREKENAPSPQLTSEEVFYKFIFQSLFKKRNVCLKIFSMTISLIHFEIAVSYYEAVSVKNLTNKACHKAGSPRGTGVWDAAGTAAMGGVQV